MFYGTQINWANTSKQPSGGARKPMFCCISIRLQIRLSTTYRELNWYGGIAKGVSVNLILLLTKSAGNGFLCCPHHVWKNVRLLHCTLAKHRQLMTIRRSSENRCSIIVSQVARLDHYHRPYKWDSWEKWEKCCFKANVNCIHRVI